MEGMESRGGEGRGVMSERKAEGCCMDMESQPAGHLQVGRLAAVCMRDCAEGRDVGGVLLYFSFAVPGSCRRGFAAVTGGGKQEKQRTWRGTVSGERWSQR